MEIGIQIPQSSLNTKKIKGTICWQGKLKDTKNNLQLRTGFFPNFPSWKHSSFTETQNINTRTEFGIDNTFCWLLKTRIQIEVYSIQFAVM